MTRQSTPRKTPASNMSSEDAPRIAAGMNMGMAAGVNMGMPMGMSPTTSLLEGGMDDWAMVEPLSMDVAESPMPNLQLNLSLSIPPHPFALAASDAATDAFTSAGMLLHDDMIGLEDVMAAMEASAHTSQSYRAMFGDAAASMPPGSFPSPVTTMSFASAPAAASTARASGDIDSKEGIARSIASTSSSTTAASSPAARPAPASDPESSAAMSISISTSSAPRDRKAIRREQVRRASSKRRVKQKEEEKFLLERVAEIKDQLRVLTGDASDPTSTIARVREQAAAELPDQQLRMVQKLRRDNRVLKELLLQHENFRRMFPPSAAATATATPSVNIDPVAGRSPWNPGGAEMPPVPRIAIDQQQCAKLAQSSLDQLKKFAPPSETKTNVCFVFGWCHELWASETCFNFRASRQIPAEKSSDLANACWEMLTTPCKHLRVFPDVKHVQILQQLTENMAIVYRVEDGVQCGRNVSLAFRVTDDDHSELIAIKSLNALAEEHSELPLDRNDECYGWRFSTSDTPGEWKVQHLGWRGIPGGEKTNAVLNDLANQLIGTMQRWEREVQLD